jgi:multicomponent Na+:H+ antiporter subunit D
MGHWGPVSGKVLGDAFAADALGLDFALAASVIGAITILFTISTFSDLGKRELGQFTALFLLLDAALIGSALTADLLNLFVWFEVAALSSYALTAFFLERPPALEAAFKVLVLTNIASFAVFLGMALIYQRTGAVDFAQIHTSLDAHAHTADMVALGLLLAGFATKAGLVPFHGWLPDAHTAAPGPVSALFSGLMVNLGIVGIARVVFQLYTPGGSGPTLGLLMALGLVSALGGAFFALAQDDLKRLLAYDTISQMGVLTVGLASGQASGIAGASYHLLDHALFKTLLFLCAGTIVHVTGEEKLSEMGGLWRRMPAIAVAFIVGSIAIAGIPPLNGYAGVGLIHDSLLHTQQYLPLAVMLVAQVVTVAALGKATWQAFFRPSAKESFARDEDLRPGMIAALVMLGSACFAFGVLPGILIPDVAAPAASSLLHPTAYAAAVLGGGGRLPAIQVAFNYFQPRELLTVIATVLASLPVGWALLSERARPSVERVRKLMSGSVNDYATYLTVGLLGTIACLLFR